MDATDIEDAEGIIQLPVQCLDFFRNSITMPERAKESCILSSRHQGFDRIESPSHAINKFLTGMYVEKQTYWINSSIYLVAVVPSRVYVPPVN